MKHSTRAVWIAAVSTVALAVPAVAQAAEIRVDDDGAQCEQAEFQSINAAVQAAAPGDLIRVCAGTYPETVQVDKSLEIVGARPGNGRAPGRDEDPEKESIVVNAGQGGFDVRADDVTIAGFTIQGNPAAESYPNAGVYVRAGSGRSIVRNVLRDNGLGVYLEGAQQEVQVERNAFLDNRRTPNPTSIPAGGLFSAGGAIDDVSIAENFFTGNAQFGLNLGGGSNGGLVVEHNDAVDDASFLVIGGAQGARVAHNRAERIRTGVFAFGGNQDLLVEHNRFRAASTGVQDVQSFGAPPNAGLVIRHNDIRDGRAAGVFLSAVSNGAVVEHNVLEGNLNGVHTRGDGARVAHNVLRGNRRDGIWAEVTAAGNTFADNVAFGNAVLDCEDNSEGPGTGGTANVWLGNKGRTDNRGGALCATGGGKK